MMTGLVNADLEPRLLLTVRAASGQPRDVEGRAARWFRDPRGAVPAELRPILQRLAIDAKTWLDRLAGFGRSIPPRGEPCVEHGD